MTENLTTELLVNGEGSRPTVTPIRQLVHHLADVEKQAILVQLVLYILPLPKSTVSFTNLISNQSTDYNVVESKHYIDGMVSSASTALINVSTELATFLNKLHSNADDEMPQETIKNLSEHIGKETQSGLVAIANRIQSVVNTQQIEIQNLMNRRQAVQKRINDLCKELELVPEAQTKYIPCGHSSPCSSMECVEITKLATKSYNDVQVEVEREVKEKRAFERNFINLFK